MKYKVGSLFAGMGGIDIAFVQWHSPTKVIPGCIQFHHQFKKIKKAKKN